MLKNFWYAIAFSPAVKNKPIRVTALGQELVIYRNTKGEPIVMSDLCVHRGGALSDGWTKGDCIVCPYHGWEYQQDGSCIKIPANLAGVPVPRKARVDAYPSYERYGFIWAFLGDLPEAERPPKPEFPEFDDPQYRPLWGDFTWKAHYTRTVENGMDIAHAPFVHAGSFGNPNAPEVEDYQVSGDEWSGRAYVTLRPPAPKGLWSRVNGTYGKSLDELPGVKTGAGFMMPNITRLEVNLSLGSFVLYTCHLPVNDELTISKWLQLRTFFKQPFFDGDATKRVIKIFLEDQPTVEAQRPEILPYDLGAELSVRSDSIQIAYRRLHRKYLDMGWGIDTHKIAAEFNKVQAVVIPSPARREVPELAKAWVMKEVPVRGKEAEDKTSNGSVETMQYED